MYELETLRTQIDHIDRAIIEQLAKRERIVLEIARFKRDHHLPILQEAREDRMLACYQQLATELQLSSEFIREVFSLIIKHSCRVQSL